MPTIDLVEEKVAACQTTKLVLRFFDGKEAEAVIIPQKGYSTLCLSSQVGCARGCTFCVTASMGLKRNLQVGEIVGQVWMAQNIAQKYDLPPLRNLVFMGMGEPLDNLEGVSEALKILQSPQAFAFGPNRITLSTVGPSPKAILAATELNLRWAWSLHAADQALRRRLIPTASHRPETLRDAFAKILRPPRDDLFIEITLMDGVNDSAEHAMAIADFLAPLPQQCRINLIPMNPGRGKDRPSLPETVEKFRHLLIQKGFICIIRHPRGDDTSAACGQLVRQITQREKEPRLHQLEHH